MIRSLRILLVDDHRDGADSLCELLRLSGYPSKVVYTSSAALEAVAAEPPDVFITDIGMPRLNGCELAGQVRALCGQAPLMIAITGYGHADLKERCLNAGFDHFFLKPADPADILAVLLQYADRLW